MKKLLFSLLFALVCCPAFSQSFPTDSATWLVEQRASNLSGPDDYIFYVLFGLEGDSVVNGQTYSVVHEYWSSYKAYYGLLRWDTASKQVFYRKEGGHEEYMLYDFDLELGDTVIAPGPDWDSPLKLVVMSIDTAISMDGKYHKKWTLEEVEGGWWLGPHVWVEGIGSESHGLFYPDIPGVDHSAGLSCFSNTGRVGSPGSCALPVSIADEKEYAPEIYPNPVADYLYIKTPLNGNYSYTLYTINGQLLQSGKLMATGIDMTAYPKGLYILTIAGESGSSTYRVFK